MRKPNPRLLFCAGSLLGLATLSLRIDAADPLPAGNGVMAADVAFLTEGLAKEPQRREVPTLKAVAMLLALNAQNQMDGKDAAAAAGQRDAALAVAEAVTKKDYAGAKAAAANLAAAKPAAAAKPLDLATLHKFDLAELMSAFRKKTVGGLNLEADVRKWSKSVDDPAAAALAGGRIALIGQYTAVLPWDINSPAKKEQWKKLSDEMTKLGADAAAEGAKGAGADKAKLAATFKALDANCNACHSEFRD